MFLNKFEDFVCKQVASCPARFSLEVLGHLDLVMVSIVDDEIKCCISPDKRWTMMIEGGPTINCGRFSFLLTCTKSVGCKTKYIPVCCKTFDPIFEISPYSHGQNA